jgi:hypothetical protein
MSYEGCHELVTGLAKLMGQVLIRHRGESADDAVPTDAVVLKPNAQDRSDGEPLRARLVVLASQR